MHIIGRHLSSVQYYLEYLYVGNVCRSVFPRESTLRKKPMKKDQAILAKIFGFLPSVEPRAQ